ncbi:EamA family transporter [Corticicoccus populi]|uniref:EamA family transporter n=1 Tax=Corticicoccus populi TaxID=1812821 RepID=A0ABW5WY33_9STAP
MTKNFAPVFVLLAAVLWGTTGTAKSFGPEDVDSISMGVVRLAFGGLTLLIVSRLMGKLDFSGWPLHIVFTAALSMALFQPFFFSAVDLTGVAVGTVVSIGSAPVFSGIIEWLFFKTKPALTWYLSTLLAITGCIILMFNSASVTVHPLGVMSGLGAGISFAAFTLTNSRIVRKKDPIACMGVVFTVSAIMLSPTVLFIDFSWITESAGIGSALFIGFIATALAYYLFGVGLKNVQASTAVTLSLAEPLTASILGVFLVGEVLDFYSWTGLIMLLAGIIILVLQSRMDRARLENITE